MIRDTSIESYYDIIPKLPESQETVYLALKELEQATDCEIARYLNFDDPNKVRPRRFELVEQGYVEEIHRRRCDVTGRNAIVWALADYKKNSTHNKPSCLTPTQLKNVKAKLRLANKYQLNIIKDYIQQLS